MSKRKLPKVTPFPAQAAVSRPETKVTMPPEMQMILAGLEEGVAMARGRLQSAEQRYGAYVVQCAAVLNVNDQRYMFDAQSRTYIDNPNFKEPEPNGSGTASVTDDVKPGASSA